MNYEIVWNLMNGQNVSGISNQALVNTYSSRTHGQYADAWYFIGRARN